MEGHVTQMPDVCSYSSMVTRDTVHIDFTMAALHGLQVKVVDVLSAYVQDMTEKRYG